MPQNKKRKPYLYIHHVFYDGILDEHIQRIITYGRIINGIHQSRMVRVPDRIYFCNCAATGSLYLRSQKDLRLSIL